jgi:colanic acid/amylovoran biosynthesis glycosyltransferase
VISTYIAGIPELVRESANGWLVAAGDTAALTTALREALDCTPSELDSMGHEGSKRVREQHFVQTEVSKLEALLTKATSNR